MALKQSPRMQQGLHGTQVACGQKTKEGGFGSIRLGTMYQASSPQEKPEDGRAAERGLPDVPDLHQPWDLRSTHYKGTCVLFLSCKHLTIKFTSTTNLKVEDNHIKHHKIRASSNRFDIIRNAQFKGNRFFKM